MPSDAPFTATGCREKSPRASRSRSAKRSEGARVARGRAVAPSRLDGYRPIEQIASGDTVLSSNERTGETVVAPVGSDGLLRRDRVARLNALSVCGMPLHEQTFGAVGHKEDGADFDIIGERVQGLR